MSAAPETKEATPPPREAANNPKRWNQTIVSNDRLQLRFPDETVADLRHRLPDYLAALGVELRRQGNRLVGRCPNHEDRSPSFAVFGTRHESCGCYPCGFSGDVFSVSEWMGRSSTFPEAVRDVAAALGVYLPQVTAGTATRPATAPPRPAKAPEPPFVLSPADKAVVDKARLRFSDAFHSGDPIIDRIAESLGLERETLRIAAWGSSGLGLAAGSYDKTVWLCYAYPQGLKWRNPDPLAKEKGKARFDWPIGKATAPWRMGWVTAETRTVYLTEGESDCMAMIAAGIEADGTTACVATPGTSFPREWASLFRGKRVVLCFDGDNAGRAATATVAAILKGHAREILTWKGAKP
jgi:hypothetical protein